MTGARTVDLELGPGLAFRFESMPQAVARRIETHLMSRAGRGQRLRDEPPLLISASRPPDGDQEAGEVVAIDPPYALRRSGRLAILEAGPIVAWCDVEAGLGGLWTGDADEAAVDAFAQRALPTLLFELALGRGWLGLHAAAVAVGDDGVLLPGDSNVGKSTIFTNAHRAGLDVLSDDLVWVRATENGFRVYPFPRGETNGGAPLPTTESARIVAIVCPSISLARLNSIEPIEPAAALEILSRQASFLATDRFRAELFKTLVRLVGSVPCFGLRAGRDQQAVPDLLAAIASDGRPVGVQ